MLYYLLRKPPSGAMSKRKLTHAYEALDLSQIALDHHVVDKQTINRAALFEYASKLDTAIRDDTSFFVVTEFITTQYIYVSRGVRKVVGYSVDDLMAEGLAFLFKITHPRDLALLNQIHSKLFKFYYDTPHEERLKLKFSFNFRIKRSDGSFMHILQQTSFIQLSDTGEPLADFSTLTDISIIKPENHLFLDVHKLDADGVFQIISHEAFSNYQGDFTPRQIQIIELIEKGFTTKQIAESLFLSPETVKNHRKKIIKLSGSKNLQGILRRSQHE